MNSNLSATLRHFCNLTLAELRFAPLVIFGATLAVGGCSPTLIQNPDSTGGAGGAGSCPTSQLACGVVCVDPKLDPANCGMCGNACASGEVCSDGTCGLTCVGGSTKCGSTDAKDICTVTAIDPLHCGMCGNVCAADNAKSYCAEGACEFECDAGFGDCNAMASDGCETTTSTDKANCGGCDKACAAGETCEGSACKSPPAASCGNGALDSGEECDDSNANKCDGCESCSKQYVLNLPAKASAKSTELAAGLPGNQSDACYEAWGLTNGTVADAVYLSSTADASHSNFILRCQSGNLVFAVENGGGTALVINSSAKCGDNKWHHVVGCRDVTGSNLSLTLYFDGTQVGTLSGTVSQVGPAATVFVGGVTYGQDGLAGSIDEVRVSKSLRYTVNFTPARHFTPDADTVALWHFNEGTGTTFADASGNNYGGTIVGGTWGPDTGYKPAFCP